MTRYTRITKKGGPPITGECDICGERTYLPFQCKKCLGIFCDKHHLPENHSCIPISKIIQEIKQFEEALPKSEEEEIKNKISEINRIMVRLQTMYESGEIGRIEYLDKINSFNREKQELEAKLKQLENIGANSQKGKPEFEKQDKELDNSNQLDNNKYSYTVDEKYRREYVGDINKANYSHTTHNLEDDGTEPVTTKNRCQFCYNPIIGMPFKCYRCGLSYCADHRLPENHQCALQKYTRQRYEMNSYLRWILIIIILGTVIIGLTYLISQIQGQRNSNSNPVIESNNSINISKNFNKLKESISEVAVETKIKRPEINASTLESRIHELINEKRRQNGLSALRYDSKLADIARKHSQDMATNNFFDHVNFNGEDPTARGLKSGYRCYKDYGSYYVDGIAENLFQNNLYDSVTYYNGIPSYDWNTLEEIAQSTVNGWMNSLGHRQNILTSTYDKEGIGVAIYSNEKVLITQNFC